VVVVISKEQQHSPPIQSYVPIQVPPKPVHSEGHMQPPPAPAQVVCATISGMLEEKIMKYETKKVIKTE